MSLSINVKPSRHSSPRPHRFMTWVNLAFYDFLSERARHTATQLLHFQCPSRPGLISIVLPVCNGEDFLRETLESILAQTYQNFELVIVNDGSTDHSADILAEYAAKDSRIRVLHQSNSGLPGALNRGFREASGQYLTWTSSDNRLHPGFLRLLLDDLTNRPSIDMVYANYNLIDERGQALEDTDWCRCFQAPPGSSHIHLMDDVSILNFVKGNYIGPAFLYRDRVAHLIGEYNERFFSCEDYDFHLRVNENLNLRHTRKEDCLYDYRIHSKSLSARSEELGREQKVNELLVFDNYRRSFIFYPISWLVEATATSTPCLEMTKLLSKRALTAGHVLLSRHKPYPGELPRLWMPSIYVLCSDDLTAEPPVEDTLPSHCLKAFIYTGAGPLLDRVDEGWDICLATHPTMIPKKLPLPRQGWYLCSDPEELWTVLQIRVRTRHTEILEQQIETGSHPLFDVSVVICTYKRPAALIRAVESVCQQCLEHKSYELIIVNNELNDDLQPILSQLRERYFGDCPSRLKLVLCPLRGLSYARNAGIATACGKIIAFLDDDAIAEEGWLQAMVSSFDARDDLGVVGGPIVLRAPSPKPFWYIDDFAKYWSQLMPVAAGLEITDNWWSFPYGGNWACRREVLLRIGGFRSDYGRRKNDSGLGEEIVSSLLIQQLCYKIGVHSGMRIRHEVDRSRFSLRNLFRTIYQGWRLKLKLEKELYITRRSRWLDLSWHCLKRLVKALSPGSGGIPQRIEHLMYAFCALFLALEYAKIQLSRLRSPKYRRDS